MFTLLIPTHNEENRIGETLEALFFYLHRHHRKSEYEVLVVDDGNDRTSQKVGEFMSVEHSLRLRHFPKRMGKGGALMKGFALAKGDVIITYDADGAIPAREIPKMLLELKKYDLVIGSRSHPDSDIYGKVPLRRRLASYSFNTLVNLLFGLGIGDTQCGLRAYSEHAFSLINTTLDRYEFDTEVLHDIKRYDLRFVEVPIHVKYTDYSQTKENRQHVWSGFMTMMRILMSE